MLQVLLELVNKFPTFIFQKSRDNLKILDDRKVIRRKFHTEDP